MRSRGVSGRPIGISASDVVPFTQARATLSDLAEQVKAGAEKIVTRNGESDVALIDTERLYCCHRLARERIHRLLTDDARRGLADIAAGRTRDADAGIAALQARRAGALTARTKGKAKASGTARRRG
jgi:antitoxin (DNA-binding transcriptional repressor) of toxin-antitoxin stability system